MNEISEIIPNRLYLTSLIGAKSINIDIDIIVSIMDFNPFINSKEYEYYYFYAADEEDFNISQYFDSFYKIMDENPKKKVLVHCYGGVSRSATLIASYLIKILVDTKKEKLVKKHYTLKFVLNRIIKRRSIVDPNYGFINALEIYRTKLINDKFHACEKDIAKRDIIEKEFEICHDFIYYIQEKIDSNCFSNIKKLGFSFGEFMININLYVDGDYNNEDVKIVFKMKSELEKKLTKVLCIVNLYKYMGIDIEF